MARILGGSSEQCLNQQIGIITVSELVGWVRNVVLIKCIFGSGKPKRGRDFGGGGYNGQVREEGRSLRATWERGGRILSQKEGSK